MVALRGEVWWADLGEPAGSEPGYRHPVVVVQEDELNRSRLSTTVVALLTSNLRRADAAGNVLCPARLTGLPKDSVVNVSQLATVDKTALIERVGALPPRLLRTVDDGLRLVLAL
ncbi:MAG: type II toxin-antitoxin system PemK/MazF family toxin [Thermoanaerobaculia bacterium]|nr:type II toxin-antitoxin system PemK/MazF family toxin [Thermoanaerobaculia bacterium]